MKFLEKLSSRMAKSASTAVKEEVQTTALDLLPTLIGLGGMILGVLIFKDKNQPQVNNVKLPDYSTISITTNNYYFGDSVRKEDVLNGEH